jgi:hypothetical protein
MQTAKDRRNLLNSAKHSEEANDHYEYSDRSLSHCVTLGAQTHHSTHTHSCIGAIDHTLSAIERTQEEESVTYL